MTLALYNHEVCSEENEIRSLNLIFHHCSRLYLPPNSRLVTKADPQERRGDPKTTTSGQLRWLRHLMTADCDCVKTDKEKCFKIYIFTPGTTWILIPLVKIVTGATVFHNNSHLTGPALTVGTSQSGSSRSSRRGTVGLEVHLPVSSSITFCVCSKHVHTGSIFPPSAKPDEGELWRLKVNFPPPASPFWGTACLLVPTRV